MGAGFANSRQGTILQREGCVCIQRMVPRPTLWERSCWKWCEISRQSCLGGAYACIFIVNCFPGRGGEGECRKTRRHRSARNLSFVPNTNGSEHTDLSPHNPAQPWDKTQQNITYHYQFCQPVLVHYPPSKIVPSSCLTWWHDRTAWRLREAQLLNRPRRSRAIPPTFLAARIGRENSSWHTPSFRAPFPSSSHLNKQAATTTRASLTCPGTIPGINAAASH